MYSGTLSAGAAGQDINPERCQARARHGQLLAAGLLAGLLCGGLAGAAGYTWDGNGSVNASGTWGTTANWNPDGIPGGSDTVLLPDVTTGTRTVTNEAARSASTLTLTQTTAGATNKLVLGANLSLPSAVNVAFSGSGPTEIDIANYIFSAFGGNVDRSYGSNITWRSSGGTINPGASPGTLTVNNAAVNFGSGGTLAIEIVGLPGGQSDALSITGTGSLNLSGVNDMLDLYIQTPYYSQIGDTLTVVTAPSITGSFDTLRLFGGNWPGAYTVSYPGGGTRRRLRSWSRSPNPAPSCWVAWARCCS